MKKLAEFFNINQNDLMVAWLSDKIVDIALEDELTLNALAVAEEKILYKKSRTINRNIIIIKSVQNNYFYTLINVYP